jgi:hypothetical protein
MDFFDLSLSPKRIAPSRPDESITIGMLNNLILIQKQYFNLNF